MLLPTRAYCCGLRSFFAVAFIKLGCERIGMCLYSIFVAHLGVISFSTHCICMTLCDIFYNFGQGFSKASLALAAKGMGKGESDTIPKLMRSATPLCIGWATLAALLYFIGRTQLMMFYSTEPEAVQLGSNILVFVAVCCFPQTLSLCYSGILRGSGYTPYVAKYSFWSIAVLRPIITFIFIFVFKMDLYGAWIALMIDQTLRMTCATRKLFSLQPLKIQKSLGNLEG